MVIHVTLMHAFFVGEKFHCIGFSHACWLLCWVNGSDVTPWLSAHISGVSIIQAYPWMSVPLSLHGMAASPAASIFRALLLLIGLGFYPPYGHASMRSTGIDVMAWLVGNMI